MKGGTWIRRATRGCSYAPPNESGCFGEIAMRRYAISESARKVLEARVRARRGLRRRARAPRSGPTMGGLTGRDLRLPERERRLPARRHRWRPEARPVTMIGSSSQPCASAILTASSLCSSPAESETPIHGAAIPRCPRRVISSHGNPTLRASASASSRWRSASSSREDHSSAIPRSCTATGLSWSLSAGFLELLHERTEGWAAGDHRRDGSPMSPFRTMALDDGER